MPENFESVTEISGAPVSNEQIQRAINRYRWAADYCHDKDVLEIACGAGIGIGLVARNAKSVVAGDITATLLDRALRTFKGKASFLQFDAQALPFEANSLDVILLVEALYYVPDPAKFIKECIRTLRPGGKVLVVVANKDLFDFHPSPFAKRYFGVVELANFFRDFGFEVEMFGDTPVGSSPFLWRVLRPLKWFAVRFNLVPKTMKGKELLRRLAFGKLRSMPEDLAMEQELEYQVPTALRQDEVVRNYKILFCAATLRSQH